MSLTSTFSTRKSLRRTGASLSYCDLPRQETQIHFYNIDNKGVRTKDAYATVMVKYESLGAWQVEWKRVNHLVASRIEALKDMAAAGTANKVARNMAYTLFKNLVDYADKYRGMQCITLDEHEAYADISLDPNRHGTWLTPPHWFDSIFHLGGFVMNGSDASNTKDFFYVTPGWGSTRLAKPLAPGKGYRSYVKMSPTGEENTFSGDVYVLQDGEIMGMMGQMKFRKLPRLLMDRFFSVPAATKSSSRSDSGKSAVPNDKPGAAELAETAAIPTAAVDAGQKMEEKREIPATGNLADTTFSFDTGSTKADSGPVTDVLRLIANETGLKLGEMRDEASFVELGVDSLMSIVLSEKLSSQLNLEVKSSVFLECPRVADLKEYLKQVV